MKNGIFSIAICITVFLTLFAGCEKGQVPATQAAGASAEFSKEPETVMVIDSSGTKVQIPAKIERIADSVSKHNAIVALLGGGDKIVATSMNPEEKPWLFKTNPKMSDSVKAFSINTSNDVSLEELVKAKPDIAFMSVGDKNLKKVAELGIPVIQVDLNSFETIKTCIKLTGEILGDEGKQRAQQFIAYLEEKQEMLTSITAGIPKEQRPKVLHLGNFSPLMVDGKDTIIDEWIELAGGINAADDLSGNIKEVSMEQVLKWNPDIIIVGGIVGNTVNRSENIRQMVKENILNDSSWKQTNAVKKGNVFINPDGTFSWDRYSAEEALQIQWAAKTIHPERFPDININNETKWFYKVFFHYELTDDEVQRILTGQLPQ